jgi:tetratricopeptide (TPR) repeat protein
MADRDLMQMHDSMARDFMFEARCLMDQDSRTEDEDYRMLYAAYAAAFHFRFSAGASEYSQAEWMISRAYVLMGNGREAVRHAQRCMQYADAGNYEEEIAWALESLARANAVLGDSHAAHEYFDKAREAGNKITDEDKREKFNKAFNTGNWYGIA